jgi:uncharacterized protein YcgL (UPF0745 family)
MTTLAAVYKSLRKADTYLYVPKKDDFSQVPEALMTRFGKPKFVMPLPLPCPKKLVGVDEAKLVAALEEQGFYLQLPPLSESLLEEHRKSLGLDPKSHADKV